MQIVTELGQSLVYHPDLLDTCTQLVSHSISILCISFVLGLLPCPPWLVLWTVRFKCWEDGRARLFYCASRPTYKGASTCSFSKPGTPSNSDFQIVQWVLTKFKFVFLKLFSVLIIHCYLCYQVYMVTSCIKLVQSCCIVQVVTELCRSLFTTQIC